MKSIVYRTVLLIGAVCVAYIAGPLWGPMEWVYRRELHQGAQLVESIEAFRRQKGRLPTEAEADPLLRPMQPYGPEGCPCYRIEAPDQFILWFQGRSVGDSLKYDSASHGPPKGGPYDPRPKA